MSWINGGVVGATSKKALKLAVEADPTKVRFYNTSAFDGHLRIPVSDLTADTKLAVCGPDPYNNRKWHATIERLPNGKLKVT